MSEQLALTLAAAAVGFASAIFFCIGNVLNTAARITDQASPRWDFSEPVARALASQRAQYVVGAGLLITAFFLQVVSALASSVIPAALPAWLQSWACLVLTVLVPTLAVAALLALALYRATMRKVLRLAPPVEQ
jgi:hypothetical protein